ncbi:hypothetical protein A8990_105159 [Paenibacillus taihuensis]|uniref:LPXTG-motif cell wall-anchored protein n=1 Tax=Paenibacillus taihuensis TaxID=1156355 RepID=A0A3D9SC36_9BACL|nr:hypothetical protein [Paenibacillus taihuensis]REE91453.1 hypothetical protein A8990_105159 [Paenibacillus taihuensis]
MRIRSMRIATLVVAIFLVLAPASAWAYSYGDANTEDVAETFKVVVSSLGKSPADWDTATAAHKERRDEIASHFGEAVAATLDADLKAHKTAETIANYKALLVMNLDRRFENALHNYTDYTSAKLLLAKARATFETLSPYAESKLSSSKLDGLAKDFDVALDAIGNPGLFGVGKKDPDEAALKGAVNRIYSALRPLFPYTPYKAEPSKPAAGTGTTTKPDGSTSTSGGTSGTKAGTTSKPSTTTGSAAGSTTTTKPDKGTTTSGDKAPDAPAANDSKSDSTTTTTATDTSAAEDTSSEATTGDAAAPDQTANADEQAATNDAGQATDDTQAADNASATNDAASTDNSGTTSNDSAAADDTAVSDAAAAAEPEVIDGTKAHAPMAHESKTNPAVTMGVIGGVVIIGAGAVWWARRKGFF